MRGKRIFRQSLGCLYQATDGIHVAVQVKLTRTEHGALDLHHVFIAVDHTIDRNGITILQLERTHVKLINIIDSITLTSLTGQTDTLLIRLTSKTTGIFNECCHTLVLTHLIEHRTLHISRDTHQTVIDTYLDHIIVLQADITRQMTVEDIVIEVDDRHQTTTAEYLDITQGTQRTGTTGTVKGIEHIGKGTQMIGSRSFYLTHNVHLNGTGVPHLHAQMTALITGAQSGAQFCLSTLHRQATQIDRTIPCHMVCAKVC